MIRYFLRAARAQLSGGKSLFLLSLIGVSLGVGAVVSIQIVSRNALGAFRGSVRAVSGGADMTIVGTTPSMPERLYPEVLGTPGVEAAWPMCRIDVALGRSHLSILGVDFFTPIDLPEPEGEGDEGEIEEALGDVGWIAVSPELARASGWERGDRFTVTLGTREVELMVGALIDFRERSPLASPRLAVMDIAQAQALFGRVGEIHQIDVEVREGVERETVRQALAERLGPGVSILTPDEREEQASDLMSAFRLNLTALSLISLFVGGFLVYSSTQANLVRRRTELGLLRSLGATHGQVFGLLLGEVLLLAVLGAAIGMGLGYVAASANVDRVSATVSNFYLLEEIHRLEISPGLFGIGLAVGLAGALLGGLGPAIELGRRDTRALLAAFDLHERAGRAAPRLFGLGLVVLVATALVYVVAGDAWRPAGFIQAFGLILAVPLIAPLLVQAATSLVRVRSFGMAYGVKGLGKQLHTTPVAIGALAVAMSMVVGVTAMVSSFRETLTVWIDATIQADIYVSTPSWRRAQEATIEPSVVEALRRHPAVRRLDRLRQLFVYSAGRRFSLAGVDTAMPESIEGRFSLLAGTVEEAARGLERGEVLLGEPLARKLGTWVGDVLRIDVPGGERIELPVAAVYYDYSSELGSAFVSLPTLERRFGPGPVHNVALYVAPSADVEAVIDDLRAELEDVPLDFVSNRRLREGAMRVFDQTFAVTELLRYMSLLIAVCGVALTLIVLARERASELALYRALGAERSQIFRVYLGKGLGMGATGVVLGTAVGIAFALVLVFVVNRAFFGWTIAAHWPVRLLVEQSLVVIAASAAASVYPALIASRTPASELRREDL